jgi:hypothetical protein
VQRPHVSHAPWAGFTKHDCPRETELPVCPSLRCRRAKLCIAAHDDLYCQRTHFSPAEQKKRQRPDPYQRLLDAVPEVTDPNDFREKMERINELFQIHKERAAAMTARWKAGEFDHLYGPYQPKGVVVKAPPKIYVERPAK